MISECSSMESRDHCPGAKRGDPSSNTTRTLALIGGHVFVVFGYHQPQIFEVFAESILKLRKYGVEGFVIRSGNGPCAEISNQAPLMAHIKTIKTVALR